MSNWANDWLLRAPGSKDFAAAYRARHDELQLAAIEILTTRPGFAGLAGHIVPTDRGALHRRYWEGVEAALDGDWETRVQTLREVGSLCAQIGAEIQDWHALAERTCEIVREQLFESLLTDPAALKAALGTMHLFFERSFCAFTEAYGEAARERLQRSEALFQLTRIGQAQLDETGQLLEANDAFFDMFAMLRTTLGQTNLNDLFVPAELERIQATIYETARATGRAAYDAILVRADGTEFPAHVDSVRICSAGERRIWGFSVYDLTERRQHEALRARSAELEAENAMVREASRVKSEFLANMSHELRTPLNSILGFSELLEAGEVGPLSEQQLDFVHDIHQSGKHLLGLINDVLDLAKVEAGKLDFHAEDVDLGALVKQAVQLARGLSLGAVEVDVDLDERVRHARLDPGRFRQVLLNYLSNAIKFSAPGGRVLVRIAPEGDHSFRLSVTDHGIGIAAHDVPRLFTLFEQLDAGRSKAHGGTGLGLALTMRLVEAQGGVVGVESELGVGSTFHAVLPLHFVGEPPPSQPRMTMSVPRGPGPVLVVDDDEASTRLMEQSLAQLGFRALIAHDGERALELVREERPIAVVLDLEMPKVDGFEFLRRFRANADLRDTPVLVWSVQDALTREQRNELAEHAQAVIRKDGSSMAALLRELRDCLVPAD